MARPKYDQTRRTMLNSPTEAFPPFENLTKHEKFIFVMQCHDWEVTYMHSQKCCQQCREKGSLYEVLSSICILYYPTNTSKDRHILPTINKYHFVIINIQMKIQL